MPSPFSNSNNAQWWISICRHGWKIIVFFGSVIIFPVLINLVSTILTNSRGIIPADSPIGILIVQWPLTLSIGISLLLFAFLMRGVGRRSIQPQSSLNREQMIRSLKRNYGNVLQALLQKIDPIELGLIWQPDEVQSPTRTLLSKGYPRLNTQPLQPTKSSSILQCYDEAEGNLLILGKSGAGKSILLLQLAQLLTGRAETDDKLPMPIIFYLSSWPMSNKSLEDWMCEQSSSCWGIPQKLFCQWINEKQIVFLLDGLDETRESIKRCISDINEYHKNHSGHSFVICSKWDEYQSAIVQEKEKLHLQNAIVVQPLTQAQINEALSKESIAKELIPLAQTQDLSLFGAPSLENVLQDISKKNPEFGELVNTPLLLSFFILICRNKSIGRQSSLLSQEIVNGFVQQMIETRGDEEQYPLEKTKKWLGWLAKQMPNNSLFYLENLQPVWLPGGRVSQIYEWIAGKGVSMLIGLLMSFSINAFLFGAEGIAKPVLFAVTGILLGKLIYSGEKEQFSLTCIKTLRQRWKSLVGWSALYGLIAGISIGPAFVLWPPDGYHGGLIAGESIAICFFFLSLFIQAGKTTQSTSPGRSWWPFPSKDFILRKEHAELGLLISTGMGISMGISMGASVGISAGLSHLVIGSLLGLFLLGEDSSIKLKEIMTFSGSPLFTKKHFKGTGLLFSLVAIWYGFSVVIESGFAKGITYGLGAALAISAVYWISFGLWGGVSQRVLDDYNRIEPNQGIRDSLQNALRISGIGFIIGIFSSIVDNILFYILRDGFGANFWTELPTKLSSGSNAIVRDVIFFVTLEAFIPFLITGGLAWLRHCLLRLLLYPAGRTPRHFKHFLDDACDRALLLRVSGAYQFRHNIVSTYFKEFIDHYNP